MSNKYGDAALNAAGMTDVKDPRSKWLLSVKEIFPNSLSSQKKGCPRGAFLGLCEDGLVKGIPLGSYTTSRDNKAYAIRAVQLLHSGFSPESASELWKRVMDGRRKVHNSQMDVVLALWNAGLVAS
jgi:hypothetical protein